VNTTNGFVKIKTILAWTNYRLFCKVITQRLAITCKWQFFFNMSRRSKPTDVQI